MEHYICTGGCMGVSDKPGVCQTSGCSHEGIPLEKCDCTDGQHYGRGHDVADSDEMEEEEEDKEK